MCLMDKKLQIFFWSEKNGGTGVVPTWNNVNNLSTVRNHTFAEHCEHETFTIIYSYYI